MANKSLKDCLKGIAKQLVIPIFLGTLAGFVATDVADKYILERDLKNARAENIDNDNLLDLVAGHRIYLANQSNDGVVYRRLENSDRQRITD